jgi:signal peptidase II
VPDQSTTAQQWVPLTASALVILADRLSKIFIQRSMTLLDSVSLIPGWLRIVHTENPGAAFGVLAEGNPLLRSAVLIGVSAAVLVFVAFALWSPGSSFSSPLTRFGLSLILGGAIGNLYDRILHGAVTDFIEVYHRAWSFPAFNVADSAITVGAAFLLLDLLLSRGRPVQQRPTLAHK